MKRINRPLHYGYSNTRVQAMKASILSAETIKELMQAKEIPLAISLLLKTDYKEDIEKFGGANIKMDLIDFVLNRNIARTIEKLIKITPKEEQNIIERFAMRWDLYNLKLALYSKAEGKSYDSIKKYIVESKRISNLTIKEALEQPNFNEAINMLIAKTPYRKILENVKEIYKRSGNIVEVQDAMDRYFFADFGKNAEDIKKYNLNSAKVIKMDIEIRNILMMIRLKKYNLPKENLKPLLIPYGVTDVKSLLSIYENSRDIKELINNIKSFDLKDALNKYEENGRLLVFEIYMRNKFYKKVNSLLSHLVLSLGVIINFFYLKESEVLTLRTIINSKRYEINEKDMGEIVGW